MAKTIFEQLGGRYERQGDYLRPCLTVPEEEEQPTGIWGERHLRYLKECRRGTYIYNCSFIHNDYDSLRTFL